MVLISVHSLLKFKNTPTNALYYQLFTIKALKTLHYNVYHNVVHMLVFSSVPPTIFRQSITIIRELIL